MLSVISSLVTLSEINLGSRVMLSIVCSRSRGMLSVISITSG